MDSNDKHVTTALEFASNARQAAEHLADLPEDEANTYATRQLRAEVSTSLRLAQVYATLATAPVWLPSAGTHLGKR